jgi:hypothetical protein
MLIGHFAAALIGKSIKREVPLWHLMLAANAMNFFGLSLLSRPWLHGLLASMALSVVLGLLYLRFFTPKRYDIACVFALVVWSHWWLDLIVYELDLLVFSENYQRWGLSSSITLSLLTELGLFVIAIAAYVLRTKKLPQSLFSDKTFTEKYKLDSVWLLASSLIVTQILFLFIPSFDPEWLVLVCFAMLISLVPILSWLVDAKRGADYRGAPYLTQDR